MQYTYTDYDAAEKALRAAEQDVINDMGEDVLESGGFYEIVHAIAMDCSPEVKRELLRTQLGEGIEI